MESGVHQAQGRGAPSHGHTRGHYCVHGWHDQALAQALQRGQQWTICSPRTARPSIPPLSEHAASLLLRHAGFEPWRLREVRRTTRARHAMAACRATPVLIACSAAGSASSSLALHGILLGGRRTCALSAAGSSIVAMLDQATA